MIVFVRFTFDAAHKLPNTPQGHKCGKLHGHTYSAEVRVSGTIDPVTGWVIDYADIKAKWDEVIKHRLDHVTLNDVPGLENPTAENIARWIWLRLTKAGLDVYEVVLNETGNAGCVYAGEKE